MIRNLLHLVFPPICIHCKQRASKRYFCDACWSLSELADPNERCIHCFGWRDTHAELCQRCAKKPFLPYPRAALFDREAPISRLRNAEEMAEAFVSFAIIQWERLKWPTPDLIAPAPPIRSAIARRFANALERPCPSVFRRIAWPIGTEYWEVKDSIIGEEDTVLLFDTGCSLRQLKLASDALLEAFPKKVYVLSLTA